MYILSFQFVPHARIMNIKKFFLFKLDYEILFILSSHHSSFELYLMNFGVLKIVVTFIFVELLAFYWLFDRFIVVMLSDDSDVLDMGIDIYVDCD